MNFNPRSPCGERRPILAKKLVTASNFNPRSPCGERRAFCVAVRGCQKISIHAPRAGSDPERLSRARESNEFQSTLPVRGATITDEILDDISSNFNPRSPCGERPFLRAFDSVRSLLFQSTLPVRGATYVALNLALSPIISIHAPRAGSDIAARHIVPRDDVFQSTLPVRGATINDSLTAPQKFISIHAPRAGSDRFCGLLILCGLSYFNPRSPCGERRL